MTGTTYSLGQFIESLIGEAEYQFDESFEDLRLTKSELDSLCTDTVEALRRLECRWCSVDTGEINEWYMVKDTIWNRYGPADGCLCIGCLEDRMGRRLQPGDFTDAPINIGDHPNRSDRLRDRLGFTSAEQP